MTSGRKQLWHWLGSAAFAMLVFVRITRELIEGDVSAIDRAIIAAVPRIRAPWLTVAAVDVTALGSITLVTFFTAFVLVLLLLVRDRLGALQLAAASIGAAILTVVIKNSIERVRPDEVPRLIAVSGFSYPSGHSVSSSAVYLTIAIVAGRYVSHKWARAAIFATVLLILPMVAASRVYLGVHYATDAISGLSLGAAWALLLGGLFAQARPQSAA